MIEFIDPNDPWPCQHPRPARTTKMGAASAAAPRSAVKLARKLLQTMPPGAERC
jgi:hypothetical protein